jgi:hypothetical protein
MESNKENKENWEEIHEGFAKRRHLDKSYQQYWEEEGFTYQETQEWIVAGFTPYGTYSNKK